MKKIVALSLSCLAVIGAGNLMGESKANPHEVYIGGGYLHSDYKINYREDGENLKDTGGLPEFTAGYEYIRPDFYYGGVSFNYAYGDTDMSSDGTSGEVKSKNRVMGMEGRLGYNFAVNEKAQVIPFAGFGYNTWTRWFDEDQDSRDKLETKWTYIALGFKSSYTFKPTWEVGLNAKVMFTVNQWAEALGSTTVEETTTSESAHSKVANRINYEVAIPVTKHFEWLSARLVPFYERHNYGPADDEGAAFFPMPSSHNDLLGARIELVKSF
ncbi:MAG: outer membrane beta-barrel protein [Chlamydiota bacterium]